MSEDKCFWCKNKIENLHTEFGKKFCSEKCSKEFYKKAEETLGENNKCEFC